MLSVHSRTIGRFTSANKAYLPWRCSYFLNDHLTFKSLAYKGSQRTEPSLQNENKGERGRLC